MRSQLHTDIHEKHHLVASSRHFSASRPLQHTPENISVSATHDDHPPLDLKLKKGIEPGQYSLAERNLRAAAFAARVQSLKFYIGLIGAESII